MKMMSWFTSCYQIVSTLFSEGKYNPDRVVAVREGSVKHVYFVAETKGNEAINVLADTHNYESLESTMKNHQ